MKEKINSLLKMSLKSLDQMLIKDSNIFCHKLLQNGEKEGTSLRYSIMSLIGLNKAKSSGMDIKFPLSVIKTSMCENIGKMDCGELGLMLWEDGVECEKDINYILGTIESEVDKSRLDVNTMQISWILTGLCYLYSKGKSSRIRNLKDKVLEKLLSSFNSETNLFYGAQFIKRKNVLLMLRNNSISSFASQIYPIHALSKCYESFKDDKALSVALKCANKICSLQGEQGQWWWMYNIDRGILAEKYPVYSVHQHGMAPMALLKLQEVSGQNFEKNIYRGVNWIFGDNELSMSLIDVENNIIWRAIQRKEPGQLRSFGLKCSGHLNIYCSALFAGNNLQRVIDKISKYEILYETRPYCIGWLLYAFANNYSEGG